MEKLKLAGLMKVWWRLLDNLHPRDETAAERNRVETASTLFAHESRIAMVYLLEEVGRAQLSETRLARDLAVAQASLKESNRLLKEARAKNAKLRMK